jgi:hypothetical protein
MRIETTIVGSVFSIRRYPVKSMHGEEIGGVEVTERGVLGDLWSLCNCTPRRENLLG